ncbi:Cytochrome P450 [Penicillium expansum]|uniref:Cytochrome P450 n=1 Tax=Penicillium expansum TaxID=27334 RepID=A0A0A2KSR8_PENEN|nr:Cytochrome P450 [Penicillium expansum]KGO41813.1 Cytochrome P450 [Penicillium expansum]KGO52057.1 Cytochrome P450 [Penicillium expansum]KGO70804.1 Cytochrome P450 [Penicillium expansum]
MIQETVAFLKDHWVLVLLSTVTTHLVYNYARKGLWRIPGPWFRGISSLPRILSVYNNKSHDEDIQLHQKYGNIVRLAPNLLSIADPVEINQIYGIGTKFYKSGFYNLSSAYDDEGLVPDTFVLTDKTLHTRMKRNASNAYSTNGLVQMESWIDPVTERLLGKLHRQAGEPIEISSILKDYAMDAVFAVTFGRDFNYIENGDVLKMYGILETVADYMAIFGQIPWIHKFLLGRPFIASLMFGSGGGDKEMMQLAVSQVESAKQNPSEGGPLTFLQRLLLNQAKDPSSINDREIMTHAFGNISAGSDTTAIALRSILYHILKDRRVYDKLYDEFRALEAPVQFADANKLPYFAAVIQEALRLHPSVGMMLARIVPAGGADLCGFHLAEGTEVGINPWVLHRNPEVFPNPDSFRPERWLPSETDEIQRTLMNRSFFAFGHGAHTCSGRWISLMEMKKVIPSLMLRFEMTLVSEENYGFKNRWFTPQHGLHVQFIERTR